MDNKNTMDKFLLTNLVIHHVSATVLCESNSLKSQLLHF